MKQTTNKLFALTAALGLGLAGLGHADPVTQGFKKANDSENPPMVEQSLVSIAMADDRFDTLSAALKATGLDKTLSTGEYTIFAPTDDAFAKLPKATLDDLMKPENKDKLTSILTYHVVPARVPAASVRAGNVKTVSGETFTVTTDDGKVMVDAANVTATDVMGKNGIIHVIDSVLMPATQ